MRVLGRARTMRLAALAATLTAVTGLMVPTPAGADGDNTCKFSIFPTAPGGTSELTIGCFLTTATGAAGTKYKVEDHPAAVWHSGAARKVSTTAGTALGGTVITSTTAHFGAADLNNPISGPGIPADTFIKVVTATTVSLSKAVTTAVPIGAVLLVDSYDGRTVADAVFPSGTTITSGSANFCKPGLGACGTKTDVGKVITGTRLPHLATITAVTNATTATLSAAPLACPTGITSCGTITLTAPPTSPPATTRLLRDVTVPASPNNGVLCSASAQFQTSDVNLPVLTSAGANPPAGARWITSVAAAGTAPCAAGQTKAVMNGTVTAGASQTFVIGQANATAPADGTTAGQLNSELSVNPALAPGLPSCASGILNASNLAGGWKNPGSFNAGGLGAVSGITVPGAIIAQIGYVTGTVDFNAYVVRVAASTAGENNTGAHYDVIFPTLLTGIAVCSNATGVASVFRFHGQTLLSATTGKPGNARLIRDIPSGSVAGSVYQVIGSNTNANLLTKSGACTITYPPVNGFGCGGNG